MFSKSLRYIILFVTIICIMGFASAADIATIQSSRNVTQTRTFDSISANTWSTLNYSHYLVKSYSLLTNVSVLNMSVKVSTTFLPNNVTQPTNVTVKEILYLNRNYPALNWTNSKQSVITLNLRKSLFGSDKTTNRTISVQRLRNNTWSNMKFNITSQNTTHYTVEVYNPQFREYILIGTKDKKNAVAATTSVSKTNTTSSATKPNTSTKKTPTSLSPATIWLISVLGVVVIVLVILLIAKHRHHPAPHPSSNKMMEEWVKTGFDKGYTKEQMHGLLLKKGWKKEDIDSIISKFKN